MWKKEAACRVRKISRCNTTGIEDGGRGMRQGMWAAFKSWKTWEDGKGMQPC